MSYLGREASGADGACHETLRGVEFDSRHHTGSRTQRKEITDWQTENVRNDAHEEGYYRRDLCGVSRPHSGHHNHQGS